MSAALDLLEDACSDLPHATRAMFGGHGVFAPNGGMFAAVVPGDRLVLKFVAGSADHAAFAAEGAEPWVYEGQARPMTMRELLLVPDDLYDDPRGLAAWCAKAYAGVPAKKVTKKKAPEGATKPRRSAARRRQ